MNDELNGQLSSRWIIPEYAQGALWIEGDASDPAPAIGEFGMFSLARPSQMVNVRWGAPDGAILARLRWQSDSLEWDGAVNVGGYIDAIHLTSVDGIEVAIGILYMGGQPLAPSQKPYPRRAERAAPIAQAEFHAGLAAEAPETLTTWLVSEESPLLTFAQDSMLNNTRLYCFGRLAEQGSGWETQFALPILLESITLFAP